MSRVVDELIEDALGELADEAYQRRVWLSAKGPEVSSLSECISRLWDDSGLSDALERPSTLYTVEIDNNLRQLDEYLRQLDHSRDPRAVLDDPQLAQVRAQAQRLRNQLSDFASDQRT